MRRTIAALFLMSSAVALTPQQRAEVKRVEESLVAPCCYTQPVEQHMSDVAEQMREEITQMVAAGETDQEIIGHYKEIYGERILVVPDGRTRQFLFTLPIAFSLLFSGALFLHLRRVARGAVASSHTLTEAEISNQQLEAFREEIERQTGD